MKPLILMLLLAISVEAQSLPDVARKERERKAGLKRSVRVLTADTAKAPPAGSQAVKPSPAPAATPAPTPAPPKEDKAKKYAEELAKLKAKIVELQDKETALQLQIQDLKNAMTAPVSDPTTSATAQSKLTDAQNQLASAQRELAETRKTVQLMEAQGPPKP